MTTDDAHASGDAAHTMTREISAAGGKRRRPRGRWIRPLVWGTIGAGVVAAVVYAAIPKPLPVDVAVASEAPLAVTIDEAGRTRVRDKYVVSSPLAAEADRITLHPGDRVHVGTELVRLAPLSPNLLDPRTKSQAEARLSEAYAVERQARATLARAELAAESARSDAKTTGELVREGAASGETGRHAELEARLREEELSSARFGVQVATHEVELARATLDRAEGSPKKGATGPEPDELVLRSPIEGIVLRVLHESAGAVQASTPLIEIGDLDALEITADVLTADAVRIPAQAPVRIRRWGGEADLAAHVRRIEPSAFTKLSALGVEEQRVVVVIELDDPKGRPPELGDGFRVEASIEVWSTSATLVAPMSAVFREGDAFAVYLEEAGRAKLSRVELGHRASTNVEIVSGLTEGARVIEHPGPKVVDGASVRAR
ncbi:MAG: HlyD family efflux transporter periplasmic adaptor subunit [Polyangiaceae bacterium]